MSMRPLVLLPLCLMLSGCYVVFSGNQSTTGAGTTTTTAVATTGSASAGNARFGASFGAPPAPNAPGSFVALSRDSTGVLFLGMLILDAFNYLGARFGDAPPAAQRASIAETCSCYGWKPDLTPSPATE
jgi:hypothetical protein